jgi:amino acid adenylation domain-containing protein
MGKSSRAIGAMLGVMKVGAMYVPLDPGSPAARLGKIVASCENSVLLASSPAGRLVDELAVRGTKSTVVGWLDEESSGAGFTPDFTADDIRLAPALAKKTRTTPDAGAHILFTSGSTGIPKGVVVRHSSVVAFLEWAVRYFQMRSDDRISGQPPLHFDLSTFDIYGTFMAGAELHLVPQELGLFPNKLAELIRSSSLTQWFSVPSLLNSLVKSGAVRDQDFPTLRRVLWCGEVMPVPTLRAWMTLVPHASYTNLYGPTETTIASSYHTVTQCPADDPPIPIGTACPGEELRVLNGALGRIELGSTGDLYIGGVGLSPGYWNDPEKTSAAFVPDPLNPGNRIYRTGDLARLGEDGLFYFVGRADTQIKSRGYRIELGEIESALYTLGCLRECAVVAVETSGIEGKAICCAYVPASDHVTPLVVRSQLQRLVPNYMLPVRWLVQTRLPKNHNGKVDRVAVTGAFQRGDDSPAVEERVTTTQESTRT